MTGEMGLWAALKAVVEIQQRAAKRPRQIKRCCISSPYVRVLTFVNELRPGSELGTLLQGRFTDQTHVHDGSPGARGAASGMHKSLLHELGESAELPGHRSVPARHNSNIPAVVWAMSHRRRDG